METATIDGVDLPQQFSYELPVPKRRISTFKTVNNSVRQVGEVLVDPDTLISWRCPFCCRSEMLTIFDWYNTDADTTRTFVGYWGDEYEIKMQTLDPIKVKSRLFNLSGSFYILSVTTWFS